MKSPAWLLLSLICVSPAAAVDVLPGTQPLTWDGDISLKMVDDLHTFADRLTTESIARRARHWHRDFSSAEAYHKSLESNRQRLAKYLGFHDPLEIDLELPTPFIEDVNGDGFGPGYKVGHYIQRWPEGFETDGYIWMPTDGDKRLPGPTIILIHDADQDPDPFQSDGKPEQELFDVALKFVDRGYCVIVPRIINRRNELSVVANGLRKTPQPHREFIYRQAFEMGRHVLGYELAAIRGVLEYFGDHRHGGPEKRFAVVGYGEGGLLALYTAALDPRVAVVGVSGYFGPRERLYDEPIYRNVWGLLDEFGDAELAAMIAPNYLIVEPSKGPEIPSPNTDSDPKKGTPGALASPSLADVKRELKRAHGLIAAQAPFADKLKLVGDDKPVGPWSDEFVEAIVAAYGESPHKPGRPDVEESQLGAAGTIDQWHRLFFQSLVDHTQDIVRESEYVRKEWWKNADRASRDPEKWRASLKPYREHLYDEVLGRFDLPKLPPNARTRKVYDEPKYAGYEVVLDVFGADAEHVDVWTYGILLVPKDLKPGERRPVVVCQHGLEGRPQMLCEPGSDHYAYHRYAGQLAERGFVTFSPQNPYIGKDHFRQLVRKLYPLKKTLWSVIVPQHEQITDWLASLEFVDPERIGFYGLSYGGKTAMRVPALVDRYCLSICSGDFNEWIRKCTSVRDTFSYMGTHEYEMYEFDLGHTFNYAEMAYLIAPRPFMVERGHRDGVGVDEWVSYEYAKVRLLYADLKIPERTEIEYFDGPHEIHGVGTFDFLHRHLNWPK
jgi:dienelactone hydrolase